MVPGNIIKVHNRRKNITYSVYGIPENVQANQVIWDELFGFDGLALCFFVIFHRTYVLSNLYFGQDVLVRCSIIVSDHNMKLADHFQNLVGPCPVSDCYFQHCINRNRCQMV